MLDLLLVVTCLLDRQTDGSDGCRLQMDTTSCAYLDVDLDQGQFDLDLGSRSKDLESRF